MHRIINYKIFSALSVAVILTLVCQVPAISGQTRDSGHLARGHSSPTPSQLLVTEMSHWEGVGEMFSVSVLNMPGLALDLPHYIVE